MNQARHKPRFQQLQERMTQTIRDPALHPYHTEDLGGLDVEARRIQAYQALFFNNLEQMFRQMLPVTYSLLPDAQWQGLIRAFLKYHQAHTPLFHKLGQEWLRFLQDHCASDWLTQLSSPLSAEALLELSHYEWIELDLSIQTQPNHTEQPLSEKTRTINLSHYFQVSNEIRLLAYTAPVHTYCKQTPAPASSPTFLLAQRQFSPQGAAEIHFHQLNPALYAFLTAFTEDPDSYLSVEPVQPRCRQGYQGLEQAAQLLDEDKSVLAESLTQALPELINQRWLIQI